MRPLTFVCVAATIAIASCGGATTRPPAATPTPPATTATATATATPAPDPATELTATHDALETAIDAWRNRTSGPPPAAVTAPAKRQQQLYRRLANHPHLAAVTIARLHGPLKAQARAIVRAQRALKVLNAPFAKAHLKLETGPPEPAGRLLGYYREAHARSGVSVPLLAAVNLVESSFGRLRNDSVAGAQGPMQFIRATWRTYGHGGDVHDPRDAILGAARLLRAGGAPEDERGALYRYNPSPLYVTAVAGYAAVMRADPHAYFALYAWPAPVP
jgi:membrane-bound lytic murein transglycosylase B